MSLKFRNTLWFAGIVLFAYLGAIVLANFLITRYGQVALPFVAFALIPFDLIARDLMQDHWIHAHKGKFFIFKRMLIVILLGALISWLTGTGSLRVNIASCSAFIVAGGIDALTYQWMIRYGRIFRINGATITAAITDSVIFVFIAFNAVIWELVGLQIVMKVSGGFVWSLLLYRLFRKQGESKPEESSLPILKQEVIKIRHTRYVRPLVEVKCPNCNHSFDEEARYVMVSAESPEEPFLTRDGKVIASFSRGEIQMQVDSTNKFCNKEIAKLRVLDIK